MADNKEDNQEINTQETESLFPFSPLIVIVKSEKAPKKGQKHRSSDNFSIRSLNQYALLSFTAYYDYDTNHPTEAKDISFHIWIDQWGTDGIYLNNVKSGYVDLYETQDKLYIADPNGAIKDFTVVVQAAPIPNKGVLSSTRPLKGQDNRSSNNFTTGYYNADVDLIIKVSDYNGHLIPDDNIVFDIKADRTGSDPTCYKEKSHNCIIKNTIHRNLYIANPKNAQKSFVVMLDLLLNRYNWMNDGRFDSMKISEISIAGTHDSAAINPYIRTPYSCHYTTITEQLYSGIRLLDVRIKVKKNNNTFEFVTCHGDIGFIGSNEYQSLKSLFDECDRFLSLYPSEFIIITLKIDDWNGYNNESDAVFKALNLLIHGKPNRICCSDVPTVKEARGNIILLSRLGLKEYGRFGMPITWSDNTEGETVTPNENRKVPLFVQDKYTDLKSPVNENKLQLVTNAFKQKNDNNILINFASATTKLVFGVYIIKDLLNYFGKNPGHERHKKLGWTLFDYETDTYSSNIYGKINIVDYYIDANYGYSNYPKPFILL